MQVVNCRVKKNANYKLTVRDTTTKMQKPLVFVEKYDKTNSYVKAVPGREKIRYFFVVASFEHLYTLTKLEPHFI